MFYKIIKMLASIYEQFKEQVEEIAISTLKVIDTKTGHFYAGGSFDDIAHMINLKKELEKYIDVSMSFGNNAKCTANTELGFDILRMLIKLFVYMIGTAISRALINIITK